MFTQGIETSEMNVVTVDNYLRNGRKINPQVKGEFSPLQKIQGTETESIKSQFAATNPSCKRRHGNCNLSGAHNA